MQIEIYTDIINNLNPLIDSKFEYKTKIWSKLNTELKDYLSQFENQFISRETIIKSFKKYYLGHSDFCIPFGLVMVWGFADTGYGTYRTNSYYNSEINKIFIENSFELVSNNKIEQAYKELQKIKGINISYISKLLYFATRANEFQDYCLIYDIRVAKSLVKLTCPQEIYEIVEIKPSNKYVHYDKYNKLMHRISKENNISAESLEMFLFNQIF